MRHVFAYQSELLVRIAPPFGDVLDPEAGVMGIGSGGNYALAAARALVTTDLDPETIVRRSLDIAADICVYTNRNVTIEMLKT